MLTEKVVVVIASALERGGQTCRVYGPFDDAEQANYWVRARATLNINDRIWIRPVEDAY